ncbi:MAG: glycosyltransferase family 2 protein [Gemmatimonadales bacterium]
MNEPVGRLRTAAVITFYRDDRFFPEALASVLAQTRPADEIIVVDDATPAGYAETLRVLDPRVKLIRHTHNRGPGAARQTGADASTSELIAYLDADDVWLPTKLQRQLDLLQREPDADAIHTALVTVRADGRESVYLDKPRVLDLVTELKKNQMLPSALMIRRSALASVGGWSPDQKLMEDWDLGTRLVAAGKRVVFLPEPLVRFRRVGQGNLSSRGWLHLGILLRTMWHHRELYRRELGLRRTVGVAATLIRHEGFRRGGVSGRALRVAGRAIAVVAPRG